MSALAADLGRAGRYMAQSFRLMVGVPDYGSYVAHMQATHPDQAPMSYEDFFRERQAARYGSRMGRCC
ncbi:YbdD/YjiX family protein [Roseateles sp. DAIF2]|uniref:YbdD/YjiX family protein n=1 Tax=Roseateles sp. DAIF2 TaxID=2714952 RepID=UPI0035303482